MSSNCFSIRANVSRAISEACGCRNPRSRLLLHHRSRRPPGSPGRRAEAMWLDFLPFNVTPVMSRGNRVTNSASIPRLIRGLVCRSRRGTGSEMASSPRIPFKLGPWVPLYRLFGRFTFSSRTTEKLSKKHRAADGHHHRSSSPSSSTARDS